MIILYPLKQNFLISVIDKILAIDTDRHIKEIFKRVESEPHVAPLGDPSRHQVLSTNCGTFPVVHDFHLDHKT